MTTNFNSCIYISMSKEIDFFMNGFISGFVTAKKSSLRLEDKLDESKIIFYENEAYSYINEMLADKEFRERLFIKIKKIELEHLDSEEESFH